MKLSLNWNTLPSVLIIGWHCKFSGNTWSSHVELTIVWVEGSHVNVPGKVEERSSAPTQTSFSATDQLS